MKLCDYYSINNNCICMVVILAMIEHNIYNILIAMTIEMGVTYSEGVSRWDIYI